MKKVCDHLERKVLSRENAFLLETDSFGLGLSVLKLVVLQRNGVTDKDPCQWCFYKLSMGKTYTSATN